MKAEQFPAWLDGARDAGAVRLLVQRARKGTGVQGTFDDLTVKGLDAHALLDRLRDDVTEYRRAAVGHFQLTAFDKDGTRVREERLSIGRDDELGPAAPDDPAAAMVRACTETVKQAQQSVNESHAQMLAFMRDGQAFFGKVIDGMGQALEGERQRSRLADEKTGELLQALFKLAAQERERENDAAERADRRVLIARGLEEGLPILGMLLAKASKRTGPAMLALFKSIDEEQLGKLTTILRPEQLATFSSLVDMVQKEQKGEGEANGAS